MLSIVLASVSFLALLTLVVYYSNEALEEALLDTQTRFELDNIRELLAQEPGAVEPKFYCFDEELETSLLYLINEVSGGPTIPVELVDAVLPQ